MMMARPTAASAAATTITKKTKIWPETWCYTLTQAWLAGLNVLAFDIGAPADRIRRTGRGRLCPLGLPAPAINRLLMEKTTNFEVAA